MEKRLRSPNYPALSLPEALEKVAAIYRANHHHSGPREVVAKAMGYAGLNGASATAISALHKYGLLDRAGEEIKVSERAMRIMHPHSPMEKVQALREAATEPQLFKELAERFPGKMPNEDLLKNYLVRNGFAPAALSSVISAYRETSDMVERESGGYDSEIEHPIEAPMNTQPVTPSVVPPIVQKSTLLQHDDRQVGRYDFEGGAYVRIGVSGDVDTETALEMAQIIIDLKRKELARRNKIVSSSVENSNAERKNGDGDS